MYDRLPPGNLRVPDPAIDAVCLVGQRDTPAPLELDVLLGPDSEPRPWGYILSKQPNPSVEFTLREVMMWCRHEIETRMSQAAGHNARRI